ncbi:gamma-glutamyltransferase family protein [Mycolicibacterium phlei]
MTEPGGVRGDGGVVATSHPLAVRAGVQMLEGGGTAADAAVAAAAVLCVVDPRSTGIGGDAFALTWTDGAPGPTGLAGAGPAPAAMTPGALAEAGHDTMPDLGPWSITVPGSVSLWERLLERYGRLGLERVLQPAIDAARGFEIAPVIADEWRRSAHRLRDNEAARTLFLPGNQPPRAGHTFANPELGVVLQSIAAGGADVFYRGELAERIGAAVAAAGGPLRAEDLAAWQGAGWVEPIRRGYRGVDVFEMPPPGQGIVVLEALGIFDGVSSSGVADAEHAAIESLKLAFADAAEFVADPDVVDVPVDWLLSADTLAERRSRVDLAAAAESIPALASDTVYVAVVDGEGTGCSLIQSLYQGFGSGVAVPGTGMLLQNRGSNFSLVPGHPNQVDGGKRPYHTIIPAMLGRNGTLLGCLGVVGGFMQPQGQMQIIRRLVDDGMGLQEALDAPRVRYLSGRRIAVEDHYEAALHEELVRRGHEVGRLERFSAGGAQAVLVADDGGLVGASDPRKDGCAMAAGGN